MAVPALGTRHTEPAEVGVDLEPSGYPATFSLEPSSQADPQRTQEGLGPDGGHQHPPAQYVLGMSGSRCWSWTGQGMCGLLGSLLSVEDEA